MHGSMNANYANKQDILTEKRESGMALEKQDFPHENGNVEPMTFSSDIYIGHYCSLTAVSADDNTGMDITCMYTSFYSLICDSVRLLHVTSDVIRTIVVRRRPNRMLTYVIT